jgi:Htaa
VNEHTASVGALSWGIKASFRDYLSRQADFSLNLDGGADIGAGNTVRFPLAARPPVEDIVWSARGHAVYRAHGGMMRLSLRDPRVVQAGSDLVLAFDFGSGAEGSPSSHFGVARLVERPSADPTTRTYQAFLLPEATGLFNDMYDADSELDDVTVVLEATS